MQIQTRYGPVNYVEHGGGLPVVVLHGGGVDHRETASFFEPVFEHAKGFRRIYPDLPGMGRSPAGPMIRSAENVLEALIEFSGDASGGEPYLLAGHSAGTYYARAMALTIPKQIAGLALICPLLPENPDVPEHRVLVSDVESADRDFTEYFVIQTPEMLDRYERFVAPGGQAG